jgi:hypothetical protein
MVILNISNPKPIEHDILSTSKSTVYSSKQHLILAMPTNVIAMGFWKDASLLSVQFVFTHRQYTHMPMHPTKLSPIDKAT